MTDILGFETEVSRDDMISKITPVINKLSQSICDEILRLNNHKPPQAVMLVGGGSLTPEIPKKIAKSLDLPENRVAIRGIDAITSVTIADNITKGPELVTPIGIAIAAQKSPIQYHTVYVNEGPVRLFEVNKLTIGDCLLSAGIKINDLYGRPGLAMIVTLNDQNITLPGEHGEAPIISKNGNPCSFDEPVEDGDHILSKMARTEKNRVFKLKNCSMGFPKKQSVLMDSRIPFTHILLVMDYQQHLNRLICDRDQISCTLPETIEKMLSAIGLHDELAKLRPFQVNFNRKETFIPLFSGKLFRNGIEVKLSSSFEHLDELIIEEKKQPTLRELAEMKQVILSQSIPISFNGKKIILTKKITEFYRGDELLTEDERVNEGDQIVTKQHNMDPFTFQDLFKQVQINIPVKATGHFTLLKNNRQTTFLGKIEPGDDLKITWPLNK